MPPLGGSGSVMKRSFWSLKFPVGVSPLLIKILFLTYSDNYMMWIEKESGSGWILSLLFRCLRCHMTDALANDAAMLVLRACL